MPGKMRGDQRTCAQDDTHGWICTLQQIRVGSSISESFSGFEIMELPGEQSKWSLAFTDLAWMGVHFLPGSRALGGVTW